MTKQSLKERLERLMHNSLLFLWIAILLLCPIGIIASAFEGNPYALGLFIGLTMLFYWVTGMLFTLIKGWRLDK